MKKLKRLPNGYKQKVEDAKRAFVRITENFEKSRNTVEQNIEWLKRAVGPDNQPIYYNIDCYEHEGKYYISFDYKIVNGEIEYNPKTGKYRLWPTCTVFCLNSSGATTGYVDSYKW